MPVQHGIPHPPEVPEVLVAVLLHDARNERPRIGQEIEHERPCEKGREKNVSNKGAEVPAVPEARSDLGRSGYRLFGRFRGDSYSLGQVCQFTFECYQTVYKTSLPHL